ncbi:hypothetical protein [Clostridium paraputrificum]|uniref:Uncharacterized protein n=1 Tax=Clostridium paraputrificum TaxID=29363 RepID=A0A6N3F8S7_9CLOT
MELETECIEFLTHDVLVNDTITARLEGSYDELCDLLITVFGEGDYIKSNIERLVDKSYRTLMGL